mmetsp:Transcript_6433/g.20856  ORF Transcript_6433/g.20856 Transcript_6433/m.20856 type:complete len:280 (-) Transcript_6433:69-908(-)
MDRATPRVTKCASATHAAAVNRIEKGLVRSSGCAKNSGPVMPRKVRKTLAAVARRLATPADPRSNQASLSKCTMITERAKSSSTTTGPSDACRDATRSIIQKPATMLHRMCVNMEKSPSIVTSQLEVGTSVDTVVMHTMSSRPSQAELSHFHASRFSNSQRPRTIARLHRSTSPASSVGPACPSMPGARCSTRANEISQSSSSSVCSLGGRPSSSSTSESLPSLIALDSSALVHEKMDTGLCTRATTSSSDTILAVHMAAANASTDSGRRCRSTRKTSR